ncbi:mitochondrial solute carrier family 25 (mitochondrial aspartate/glutamate transporter) member 12/13 [Andalucia godoyi]|uniref:Mitochondrial solute carrier family 25 (Mitochondrial aspartate/glutamate transporter) member 12/13 n=1 Tax=Andalucia godoyi TaxID=505711 RepID=A0A8K0AGA1_ANDGO|nr:mitochondrial solute carrier family 25 (mitochondrial aspartate/glutamate transporter) member 12/13 [Andalucia godoyi]|eukprot:ANDGO_06138.mRNA.1 mitochondrial solute carrier family 25 (mitochondrial aspartate/glutamate transporter) member 12/13
MSRPAVSEKPQLDSGELKSVTAAVVRFGLGVTAAVAGVTAVYPFDTIKTKLQNERKVKADAAASGPRYNGLVSCGKYVMQHEGVRGFYRGLGAQASGKGLEKGFQLFFVDMLRQAITGPPSKSNYSIGTELFAGAVAGAIQVVTTNPFELVKVRIQTSQKSTLEVLRDVGFKGLFSKGLSACLVRDVAFASLYFGIYAQYKVSVFGTPRVSNAEMSLPHLFVGGSLAGCISAWVTTPADVIKTRMQAEQKGISEYKTLVGSAARILREEGFTTFFRGAVPRMLRSAPQYGVMLLTYDWLQGIVQGKQ